VALAWAGVEAQGDGLAIWTTNADQIVVSRPQVAPLQTGFEDSLARSGSRIEILLLVNALATFARWLAELACEATGIAHWLWPVRSRRTLFHAMRQTRSISLTMADGAHVAVAESAAIPAE